LLEDNFDMESLIDFWAHEFVLNRTDTYNNRLWKNTKKKDEWSFISFDYDMCMVKTNSSKLFDKYFTSAPAEGLTFINKAVENEKFRNLLFRRMCDFLNFGYSTENIQTILNDYEDLTALEFQRDTARWNAVNGTVNKRGFDTYYKMYQKYFDDRKEFIYNSIFPKYGYPEKVIFEIPDSLGYEIFINGYAAREQVVYFTGMDITIQSKGGNPVWLVDGNEIKIEETMNFEKTVVLEAK